MFVCYDFTHAISEGTSSSVYMDTEEHVESTALAVVPATPDDSSFEVVPFASYITTAKG